MKKLILLLLIVFRMNILSAQFNVKSGTKTSQVLKFGSKNYEVYEMPDGNQYILCTYLNGEEHYGCISKPTNLIYNGHPLRYADDNHYFYLEVRAISQNPYPTFINLKNKKS